MQIKTTENDIKKYIEERINNKSLSQIFFELKKEVDSFIKIKKNTDLYSMEHNYTPIFMYYAIKNNCRIEEFSKILQMSTNYEDGLNRFFSHADCTYDEKDNSHIYNKMSYLFYKKDNDKIFFNEDKIIYINEIIKNVRHQNLLDFHSSRIDNFLAHVIFKNPIIGKNLIDLISETPTMLMEELRNYPNMPMSIVRIFSDSSYETDVSSTYKLLKSNKIFKDLMYENIIKLNFDKQYKTNLSLYQMIGQNETEYFEIFMNRVREIKNTIDSKQYVELIRDISYSIENGVKENPFKLNIEKISSSNEMIDNIPYLIALEKIIDSGSYNLIVGNNENLKNYLNVCQNIVNHYDYNDNQISNEEYYLMKKIQYNTIEKFFQYKELDSKFQTKEKILAKKKI